MEQREETLREAEEILRLKVVAMTRQTLNG
jgi:hypothetical protein